MNALEQISQMTFSNSAILYMVITCILLFLLPIVFLVPWKLKNRTSVSLKYLFLGAVGFILSARVFELGIHIFCIVLDNPVSRFINGHTAVYVLYGILMAGIFEECGRYLILRFCGKKKNVGMDNAIMYGIGHAGIEVYAIILVSVISSLVVAVLFRIQTPAEAMAAMNINEQTAESALPILASAAAFGPMNLIMTVAERIITMFTHIGLTVIVYHGLMTDDRKYLFHAIALHALVDLLPALSQKISLAPLLLEGWVLIMTILLCIYAARLRRIDKESE